MTEPRAPRFALTDARVALITIGAGVVVLGGLVLLADVPPRQYPAVALWLVGALVVHDGILAGIVFGSGVLLRRTIGRRSFAALLFAQSALAVGAIAALVVIPEILKKASGTRANPSILPLDYGLNLTLYIAALVIAAIVAVVLHAMLARRLRQASVTR